MAVISGLINRTKTGYRQNLLVFEAWIIDGGELQTGALAVNGPLGETLSSGRVLPNQIRFNTFVSLDIVAAPGVMGWIGMNRADEPEHLQRFVDALHHASEDFDGQFEIDAPQSGTAPCDVTTFDKLRPVLESCGLVVVHSTVAPMVRYTIQQDEQQGSTKQPSRWVDFSLIDDLLVVTASAGKDRLDIREHMRKSNALLREVAAQCFKKCNIELGLEIELTPARVSVPDYYRNQRSESVEVPLVGTAHQGYRASRDKDRQLRFAMEGLVTDPLPVQCLGGRSIRFYVEDHQATLKATGGAISNFLACKPDVFDELNKKLWARYTSVRDNSTASNEPDFPIISRSDDVWDHAHIRWSPEIEVTQGVATIRLQLDVDWDEHSFRLDFVDGNQLSLH